MWWNYTFRALIHDLIYIIYKIYLIKIVPDFCPNNCGKSYKHSNHLNHHVKYECGDLRRFSCTYCLKTFRQKRSIREHVAIIHKHIVN